MSSWANLFKVFGECIPDPTEVDMREALTELFTSGNEEHGCTWINHGSDNGPLYNLSVYISGYAIFTHYSDVDMTDEIEVFQIEDVDLDKALKLWLNLLNGESPK